MNADRKNGVAMEGGDDRAEYPKLTDRRLSQQELKRARSAVDGAIPWLVWPVFVVSIVVGSLSAPIVVSMKRAAPISLACWRHQVSAIAMLPLFIFEWRKLAKSDRLKALSTNSICHFFFCSLALAVHFSTYLWSLDHTSMVHCLFLTCMSPIFVAIYTKVTTGVLMTGEVIGVGLGLVGVSVLAAGTRVEQDNQSTYIGDFMALFSAVSVAAFLIIGKKLRSHTTLFVYQFPVTVLAGCFLAVIGLSLEGWNTSDVGDISGLFGWLRKEYILGTICFGLGPGLIGHAGYSFVLRYSSPLVMPTGLSIQPIIGSTIGWAFGESPTPGLWTCLGGTVTLAGTFVVACSSAKKKEQEKNQEQIYKQPAADDEEAQQGTKPLLEASEP